MFDLHTRNVKRAFNLILALVLVTLTLIVGATFFSAQRSDASVAWGNEYNAQLITSTQASGTAVTTYKIGAGSIGSIVVASTSAATTYYQITVYDATSTMSTSTARVLARFAPGLSSNGTYQYDVVYTKGLSIEVAPGFTGAYTLTWR